MKKALITGSTGQDGSYRIAFLLEEGYDAETGELPVCVNPRKTSWSDR